MDLSEARSILRGWLQDTTAGDWTNAEVNRYINLGIKEAQKTLVAIDPEIVKSTYLTNLLVPAAGVDPIYEYPVGTWAVIEIAKLGDDGINYKPLDRFALKQARDGGVDGFVPWDAMHFMLTPSPDTAVTNGLRAIVVPTLAMSDDTDVSPLPPAFDTLILKQAERLALRDVGEPTDKANLEIQQEKNEIPRFYLTNSQPAFVVPLVDRY